jgi:hypothetical protein
MKRCSRWAIMGRALVYGTGMGALTGGPLLGAFCALGAVIGGLPVLAFALVVTVFGGVIGGVVGLLGSILPGVAVATMSGYLRSRPRIARTCAASISGLEVDTVFVIGHGGLGAAAATGGGIAFLVFAFGLFASAGAYGAGYVLDRRKLAPRRRAERCLRRICPCRRFRLGALAAA